MSTSPSAPEFITVDCDAIALRRREGRREGKSPGAVWLGGFRSDMLGTKAAALDGWAAGSGRAFLRHDYSGHGESGGRFVDGTISRWLAQSLAVFRQFARGPQVLVGSSMGAWIALRMAEELGRAGEGGRVAGLLLLAPAPDFVTELMEPQLTDAQRRDLAGQGFFEEPSEYAPEPYIYTRALFEDGRRNRVLDHPLDPGCPVRILQGMEDADVPYAHAVRLAAHLPPGRVTLTLIGDGDHRLSRPQDLAMIVAGIESLAAVSPDD